MPFNREKTLRVHVGVGGRFHSDELLRALLDGGHDARLITSLPAGRFPQPLHDRIQSKWLYEIAYRIGGKVGMGDIADHLKMRAIGHSLRKRSKLHSADVLIAWSSFALEAFRTSPARKILIRDSSHIDFQNELLRPEYERLGMRFPRRSFCSKRENEEYGLADTIVVLSEFARRTFIERGVDSAKIEVLRLGVDTKRFAPKSNFNTRLPLKVVFFGTLGVRKGTHYLLEATREFSESQLELHLVGPVERGFEKVLAGYDHYEYHGAMDHRTLAAFLCGMDVFAFPTLEDGFGQTLLQAMAVGLIPITTNHCGAGEILQDGKNGYVVPAGTVQSLRYALLRLLEDPSQLESLRHHAHAFTWGKLP